MVSAYVELGRIARIVAANYAESIAVTDPAILTEVQAILESETGELDGLFDVTVDAGDNWKGKARERITQARSQIYEWAITDRGMRYKLINAADMAEFAATNEGYAEIVDYAAKSKSSRTGKKLKCAPGNIQCGGVCQSGKKNCFANMSPDDAKKTKALAKKAKAPASGTDASQSSSAKPQRPNTGKHDDIPGAIVFSVEANKNGDQWTYKAIAVRGDRQNEMEISKAQFSAYVNKQFGGSVQAARAGRVANRDEQLKAMADYAGISKDEAERAEKAIKEFAENDYDLIRNVQRGRLDGVSDKDRARATQQINDINRYIENAPAYQGEVFRGVSFTRKKDRDAFISSIANGYNLDAMSSFTSDRNVARDFASGTADKAIDVKQGKYGIVFRVPENRSGVSIRNISLIPDESEVLVPGGARYRITGTPQKSGGLVVIDLEEMIDG